MKTIYLISPTESAITTRGTRHPNLAEALVERGHQVCYITTDFNHAAHRIFSDLELRELHQKTGYETVVLPTFGYHRNVSLRRVMWNNQVAYKLYQVLRKRVRSLDSIIVPSRPPEVIAVAAMLARRTSCRILCDVRDIWPDGLPLDDSLVLKTFAKYCRKINRFALPRVRAFVHTAPVCVGWLQKVVPDASSEFIPLGFEEARWRDAESLSVVEHPINRNLIFVGNLSRINNIDPLLEALAGHGQYRMRFVGGGALSQHYQDVAYQRAWSHLDFHGLVPREAVREHLDWAHISVLVATGEAFPNKLFDALGAKRPMLVFGRNDAADFVREHELGWVLPFDVDAVHRFLEELSFDEIVRCSQNVEAIREKYSQQQLYSRFIEVIETL